MPAPARKLATSPRNRPAKPRDSASAKRPKQTQRERLVRAMIELSAQSGYQRVSVAQVSARAGVSSATFYEQFEDKEDCLLAAYRAARARISKQMLPAVVHGDWSHAARVRLGGLFEGLQSDPDVGRLLFVEALAGGPRMREERERVLARYERGVHDFLERAPAGGELLDIPAAALEGARRHIVSWHLRTHNEDRLPSLIEDILTWMRCYATPSGAEYWSAGPQALLAVSPAPAERAPAATGLRAGRLPRGRHGLPTGMVTRIQRRRIVYATAFVTAAKGYANATVADIVAAAGISRDVFYEHFTDKQHAFLEAQRYATQHIFDTCAAAYFSAGRWPERVWNALRALIGLIADNRELAHLRVVECYAAGEAAIRHTEELLRSGAIFLEEGYGYRAQARELPRLCSQAITGAVFDVIYHQLARGDAAQLPRHLPELAYIVMVPFTGRDEAIAQITRLSAEGADSVPRVPGTGVDRGAVQSETRGALDELDRL